MPGDDTGPEITPAYGIVEGGARDAARSMLADPATRTADLGGRCGTAAYGTAAVRSLLEKSAKAPGEPA